MSIFTIPARGYGPHGAIPLVVRRGYAQGAPVTPPVADFSGTPLSGLAPLSVVFTDLSTNTPTSWTWNFGDGSTSTAQNPSHTYAVAGSYTVLLTATNAAGSNSKTAPAYVTANSPVVPSSTRLTPATLMEILGPAAFVPESSAKRQRTKEEREEFDRWFQDASAPSRQHAAEIGVALLLLLDDEDY